MTCPCGWRRKPATSIVLQGPQASGLPRQAGGARTAKASTTVSRVTALILFSIFSLETIMNKKGWAVRKQSTFLVSVPSSSKEGKSGKLRTLFLQRSEAKTTYLKSSRKVLLVNKINIYFLILLLFHKSEISSHLRPRILK